MAIQSLVFTTVHWQPPSVITLIVLADKETTLEMLDHLALLARAAGIYDSLLATLPRLFDQPLDGLSNSP